MSLRPAFLEVLTPVDRWTHLAAAVGVLGALTTGPLIETPSLARAVGLSGGAATAHGVFATLAAAAWILHLVRVCLEWLEGRNPWGLVPRPSDAADLARALVRGPDPGRERYSYRERLSYAAFLVAVPALVATGWAVGHPAAAVVALGPDGLLATARVHAAVGGLALPAVLWHLYFAVLAPEKLWWNPGWLTGRVPWSLARRAWPGWTARIEAELAPAGDRQPDEVPSVQDLLEAGNRAARTGDLTAAAAAFQEALDLYPGYPQARFNLGVALLRAGDRDGARDALLGFLEQDPFGPAADRARELLARELGEVDRG